MGLIFFLVFGFIVGLVARAIMPGSQGMGIIFTTLLGIAGSFVGGFLGSLIGGHPVAEFHTTGVIGSVIGAIVLLAIFGAVGGRRASV